MPPADSAAAAPPVFATILGRGATPEGAALIEGGTEVSHGDLLRRVDDLAGRLRECGAGARTLAGVCLPLGVDYAAVLLALYRLGSTAVLLNPLATEWERAHVCEDSGLTCYLGREGDGQLSRWPGSLRRLGAALRFAGPGGPSDPAPEPGDAAIIYTSGTTGRPKGVVLTEAGLSANVAAVAGYLGLSRADRAVAFTPSGYAYALSQVLTHLFVGGAVVARPGGLLAPLDIVEQIRARGCTGLAANPTAFQALLELAEDGGAMPSVRYLMTGGQPLPRALASRLQARFPSAEVISMYGCTENSPRVSYYRVPRGEEGPPVWPVGKAVRGTAVAVRGDDGGELAPGQVGRVHIRGTSLMRGYWRNPALSAELLRGGEFRTSDRAFVDRQGDLNLLGRCDHVISVAHEKVSPEEVEGVLLTAPAVADAGVTQVPEPPFGEIVAALIVARGDGEAAVAQARAAAREALSPTKRPGRYAVVGSLPRNLYGKVDRARLLEAAGKITAWGQWT